MTLDTTCQQITAYLNRSIKTKSQHMVSMESFPRIDFLLYLYLYKMFELQGVSKNRMKSNAFVWEINQEPYFANAT